MRCYVLDPALSVLLRPDGFVQVGWNPRRAMLIRPPAGLDTATLADVLRIMHSPTSLADLQAEAHRRGGADPDSISELVRSLADMGLVRATNGRRPRSASIRIHGRGPLSDLLSTALRSSGARVSRSSLNHAAVAAGATDLVVLADYQVADPRVVRELHAARAAHLPVRVRDGAGLVGPLVIPGVTSCLGCADLHRTDRDAAWPAVAAQLRDTVGNADRATVLATAALALNQVDRVIRAVHDPGDPQRAPDPPSALDTTLEFDVEGHTITFRRWSRHPRCPC